MYAAPACEHAKPMHEHAKPMHEHAKPMHEVLTLPYLALPYLKA